MLHDERSLDGIGAGKLGGRILDPFAGSGSTLAAAELEGYDSVGVELSEEIAKRAAERLGVEVKKTETSK